MQLILAIDAGGTHCRAGIYNIQRKLIAEAEAGPCNPVDIGIGNSINTLISLAQKISPLARVALSSIIVSCAGAGRKDIRDIIAEHLCSQLPVERVLVCGDLLPLIIANASHKPAIVVIAGTGSSVYAQTDSGEKFVIGGHGPVIGDAGSAHQIAVSALQACARALDGLAPSTQLLELLPRHNHSANFQELLQWATSASKMQLAQLTPQITHIAEMGDDTAKQCIQEQAVLLAHQVQTAYQRASFSSSVPLFIHGGVFDHCHLFKTTFADKINELCPALKPKYPPLRGHRAVVEIAFLDNLPDEVSHGITPSVSPIPFIPSEQDIAPARTLDAMTAIEIVRHMNQADSLINLAIESELPAIAKVVQIAADSISAGGRIIYIGAGTSGRLGVLDASECPATFGVSHNQVRGIIAGGDQALRKSIENAEDNLIQAERDIEKITPPLHENDFVIGITASGSTPYVLAALDRAKFNKAKTALLSCNAVGSTRADINIILQTGPEVLPGSSRLKAGTATKLVLNMISTGAMALSGYIYDGMMIGIRPINSKLRNRATRILSQLTGLDAKDSLELLEESGGVIPVAFLMHQRRVNVNEAHEILKRAGGVLRNALEAK